MSEQARAASATADDLESMHEAEGSQIEGKRQISAAELRGITEALIFVAEEPLSAKAIADLFDLNPDDVVKSISDLVSLYEKRGGELAIAAITLGSCSCAR